MDRGGFNGKKQVRLQRARRICATRRWEKEFGRGGLVHRPILRRKDLPQVTFESLRSKKVRLVMLRIFFWEKFIWIVYTASADNRLR
jgi:hypothetical protein